MDNAGSIWGRYIPSSANDDHHRQENKKSSSFDTLYIAFHKTYDDLRLKDIAVEKANKNSSLDEIDGVDDILAVSHVQDKECVGSAKSRPVLVRGGKTKPPLVRAKTLPAIVAPGLTIIQTQMECADVTQQSNDATSSPPPCVDKSKSIKGVDDFTRKSKGSPGKVTFFVNHGNSWKTSNPGDSNNAAVPSSTMVTTRHISPARSSSQINMTGSNVEKAKCEHATANPNSWIGFAKLARFLNQREKEKAALGIKKHSHFRRSHSLENDDLSARKATSIDSLVTDSNSDVTASSLGKDVKSIPASPSFPSRLQRPSLDSHSSQSLHTKLSKSRTGWSRESIDYLADGLPISKSERKKFEKYNKINIHLHALFLAVENQHLEKAQAILESADVDVNRKCLHLTNKITMCAQEVNILNNDNFNTLDIAVFSQNLPMAKLLLSYGAKENFQYADNELFYTHIGNLIDGAENKVDNMTVTSLNSNVSNLSTHQLKENERQLTLWERRRKLLKKIKMGFEQIRPPDPPSSVILHVVGTDKLRLEIEEPDFQSSAIVTKYKVEWSSCEDFSALLGTEEIYDFCQPEYVLTNLQPGLRHYVRVASGNVKGYSEYKRSCPLSAVPSIWRDVDGRPARSAGRLSMIDELFNQIRNSRPEYASEIKAIVDQLATPAQQRKHQVKKSIRSLFAPAPKFHKNLKRGLFLASILYNEDRVLVTTEDYLPILEVDETYSSSLHTDFHWMMKVACTWDDVKCLRQDMEKSLGSSTVHFRSKLLQAATEMQAALGIQDLGQFFYKPIKDVNGTIVFSTVSHVKDVKAINAISMRWMSISKLARKVAISGDLNAGDLLLASISEQIQYSEKSSVPLRRGLYVGYLKLKSTMDLIRVLVPEKTPNVLPHCRVRENPHVSREEWEWLTAFGQTCHFSAGECAHCTDDVLTCNARGGGGGGDSEAKMKCDNPSDSGNEECDEGDSGQSRCVSSVSLQNLSDNQMHFGRQLLSAIKHLFLMLGVSKSEACLHRLYDIEVIELSKDVLFILVLPPVENVCSVPGQTDEFSSRQGYVALPVQIFEMIHMCTYQHDFISRYSRLSSILEMDMIMAHHAHREAFSSSEVISTKQRLCQLQELQVHVDNTWKGMRWIMDVLTYARDRQTNGGVSLWLLYERFDTYSPMLDLFGCYAAGGRSSSSRSHSPSPSVFSGHSVDQAVGYSAFHRDATRGGSSKAGCRSSLPSEKMQHLLVPASLSPSVQTKFWKSARLGKGAGGGIPKSFSDTFNSVAVRDIVLSLRDDDNNDSESCECVSLSASLKSISSDELPMDDVLDSSSLDSISLHSHELQNRDECGGRVSSTSTPMDSPRQSVDSSGAAASSTVAVASAAAGEAGVLRVHAAYDTGLGGCASIKLHVTPKTTSREVINLVVKQLHMAAVVRGKSPLDVCSSSRDRLHNYCLVAVIGARERCLRDDFCPLRLQNPWTKGRLYVRLKHDVLAALEHQRQPLPLGGTPADPEHPATL